MTSMLSIDFGNTYSKVALRSGSESKTNLISDESLLWDDGKVCVPSLAAYDNSEKKWYFGIDVMRFRNAPENLQVYRNWKPHFFDSEQEENFEQPGTAVLPLSNEVAIRQALTGICSSAQIEQMVASLITDNARETSKSDYKSIGAGYFEWLKKFIDPYCKQTLNKSVSDIPVRISIPSFGNVTHAKLLLGDILESAGWWLADDHAFLAEPLSNAIGILTRGRNATRDHGRMPDYSQMFKQTGLLERIRQANLSTGKKSAWILIVDIGGYTTDCAMLGLDLEDIDAELSGTLEGKSKLSHLSRPIGVTDLDIMIKQILHPEKQRMIDKIIADPDQLRLETFHKNCYGPNSSYIARDYRIGTDTREKEMLRECIWRFSGRIIDEIQKFMETNQYEQIDDLILTGGGTMIPIVRNSIVNNIATPNETYVHYWTDQEQHMPLGHQRLKNDFVRGASSYGGASIYFEYAS